MPNSQHCLGGTGIYKIAMAVLARAHQEGNVGGASLAFSTAATDRDSFWAFFFKTWQDLLQCLVNAGGTGGHVVTKDAFFISPTLPRWLRDKVSDPIAPLTRLNPADK